MPHLRLVVPVLAFALLVACKGEDDKADAQANAAVEGKAPAQPVATGAEAGAAEAGEAGAGEAGAGEAGAGETGEAGETDTGEAEALPPMPESFEPVGVEICDQYVADYVACISDKVPEGEREAQRRLVFDNVTAWKQTAAGGKSAQQGLQTACRIAREQAKRATQDWACTW